MTNPSYCENCGVETFNSCLCRKCSRAKTGLDFIFDHAESKQFVKENGWDAYLSSFQKEFEDYDLSSVSTPWHGDSRFIVKLRGGHGDLVGGWKGVHDIG